MRIRSLHPSYLDAKWLVALWREALLAQHVLAGTTKGYKNHPQLDRFKEQPDPLHALNTYLEAIVDEADVRWYRFDRSKVGETGNPALISVTEWQLQYEYERLLQKLSTRDLDKHTLLKNEKTILPHPLFEIVPGPIAPREKVVDFSS